MTTTLKHRLFVGEQIGNKSVRSLPGIGMILGRRLEQRGVDKAKAVLGKFLELKKDRERFTKWLKDTSDASHSQAGLCYDCLKEWCDNSL